MGTRRAFIDLNLTWALPHGRPEWPGCRGPWFSFRILAVCALALTPSFALTGPLPESTATVLGRVLESGNRSPIVGATVIVRNQTNGSQHASVTSADGVFFFSPLEPGLYTIRATCEGFQENWISGYPVRLSGKAASAPAEISLSRTGSGLAPKNSGLSHSPPIAPPKNAGEDESPLEVRVRWEINAGMDSSNARVLRQAGEADVFSLIGRRQIRGSLPRQRMAELSEEQILVVVTGEQGEQRGWTLIPDPRILRAESPGPNGELSGQVLRRTSAEFLVPLSGGQLPATLKFYQPQWTGKGFSLNLLGTLALH